MKNFNVLNAMQAYTSNEIAFIHWATYIRKPRIFAKEIAAITGRTQVAIHQANSDYKHYIKTGQVISQRRIPMYQSADMILARVRTDEGAETVANWEAKIEKFQPGIPQYSRVEVLLSQTTAEEKQVEIEPVQQPTEQSFPMFSLTLSVRLDVVQNLIRTIKEEWRK